MKTIKNAIIKKAVDFKKQNCSAPFTLTVILLTSLIIIFSFESIGLLRKEKNLDYRIQTPEQSIKLVDLERYEKRSIENSLNNDDSIMVNINDILDESSNSNYEDNGIVFSASSHKGNNIKKNNMTSLYEKELDAHKQRINLMENIILQGALNNIEGGLDQNLEDIMIEYYEK